MQAKFFSKHAHCIYMDIHVYVYYNVMYVQCVMSYTYIHVHVSRWPAMVEEDPNKETYYEMGKTSTSSVPVSYIYVDIHMCFFLYIVAA